MEATEPMTIESAAESLLAPAEETQSEVTEELESEDVPAEEEQTDTDEGETEETDAEADGEDIGHEDEEDTEEPEDEELPNLHTVKVDGEEREVTLEDLKRDYSGQAYIQKGMKEIADKRKETEAVFNALQQERAQLAQLGQQLQQGGIQAPPTPPSMDDFNSDPIGFMEKKLQYDEAKAKYDQQVQQFHTLTQKNAEAERQARGIYLAEQAEQLKQYIPEFADAEKAGEIQRKITQAGQTHYGFSAEELAQVVDARHVRVLNDARKWRELQASKKETTEKAVKKARPVVKAGTRKKVNPQKAALEKQRQRLRETGNLNDAVGLIFNQS